MSGDSIIENRDYTLIIDKSASMATSDEPNGKTRWEIAQESTLALAKKCQEIDPDGITVYVFSGRFRRYDNVTSDKVSQIYAENEPMGQTDLAMVLQDAFDNYFERKAAGTAKANGETFLIITDGEPTDRKPVIELIIDASKKIDRDEELAVSLIQVGHDKKATAFFKALDDELQKAGAKFDIVDTVTVDDMQNMSLTDVLLNAITD
ncbi:von Willebrand factor type A [Rippkaea orientalis PCC 8801]|uniref:von Willebrand factor type A n=1 Tax=Rippkaea orientalis (strain PCC 8801 / RF-1) TaxID=41431 RepID=B7JXI5_RIPO1|nr:VWA domain-containing protein [Rippkaea orientalis]ACK64742.1 von Willebrand factor type A [Rippkaea orientalis PCC 8801]